MNEDLQIMVQVAHVIATVGCYGMQDNIQTWLWLSPWGKLCFHVSTFKTIHLQAEAGMSEFKTKDAHLLCHAQDSSRSDQCKTYKYCDGEALLSIGAAV